MKRQLKNTKNTQLNQLIVVYSMRGMMKVIFRDFLVNVLALLEVSFCPWTCCTACRSTMRSLLPTCTCCSLAFLDHNFHL